MAIKLFSTIFNYIWVFFKIIIVCILFSIPFVFFTQLLKPIFQKLNKKLSFILSLYIIIFGCVFIPVLLLYFIPILGKLFEMYYLDAIGLFLVQLIRLILVSLLFSAILAILGMFISLLYDNFTKKQKVNKKQKNKIHFFNLWKSISIVVCIFFLFVITIFPKLPSIIIYLIYM